VNKVRKQQETAIRAAKNTLGQIKNPLELPTWLPELRNREILRKDVIAGLTVALILIPQSMAYAQLAGLPPHYGLYASLLPPIIAAFFGSSRQLAVDLHVQLNQFHWGFAFKSSPIPNGKPLVFSVR